MILVGYKTMSSSKATYTITGRRAPVSETTEAHRVAKVKPQDISAIDGALAKCRVLSSDEKYNRTWLANRLVMSVSDLNSYLAPNADTNTYVKRAKTIVDAEIKKLST
jgi:hypothetical protein